VSINHFILGGLKYSKFCLFWSIAVPCGCVTFKRKVVSGLSAKVWSDSTRCLTDCHFTSEKLIEDFHGAVQVCTFMIIIMYRQYFRFSKAIFLLI